MASAERESELKQQGAIEAAQDPETSVTAEDAQKKLLEESKKAGVVAVAFDPDASPEEKKEKAKEAIPDGMRRRPKGVAIATDIDDGSVPIVELPTPSKAGAIMSSTTADGKPLDTVKTKEEEDAEMAAKHGWAPRFGWPQDPEDEGDLLDHATWLESKISDSYFGQWYYNAGVIIFACIASWLVAVLGGGLGWVFIVMAACSTYYRTSIRRVRRNFRDDITRELGLKKLDTDTESLEWINSFLVKFWPIYAPVLASTITASVDQVLSGATPAFLDSLKLKYFSLGNKPPRMEHVKTYPKAEDDYVIMDWMFSFTPNDITDMTEKQKLNRIQPKVILEIRVGKAMVSKGLDVIVEEFAFSGLLRLKIKLQQPFPHIEKVEMCFLERPTIDYVCKPLGGETFGFDINFIPGLESFIQEQIHGTLAPMMYAPNVFPIELAKMLAGTPVDQAIGVVAITLHGAQGLKNPDAFAGTPDPYAVLSLSKRQPLAQTKVVKENNNPKWNETLYVIVTSLNDTLDIEVFDYNDFRKDKKLGSTSFQLENFEELHEYENERLELKHDGKARGVVTCDIRFFPVLAAETLPDGTVEPPPESNTGILRFTIEQAKDLDSSKSMTGLLNPYAQLILNNKPVHTTEKRKRTNNPVFTDASKEILITDRKKARLGLIMKDDRDIAGDQVVGTYQIKLDDMLELMAKGHEWYNLSGVKTGRAKMLAQWKPVVIGDIAKSGGGYVTPVGVLRLHFKKASQLRNFEALGKSDPYVRVLLSGLERGRTVTFKNNLNPEWDEVLYVPVHSNKERLQLEVMDAENMGRDRSLGLTEIFSGDYMAQDENGEWLVHDKKVVRDDGLRLHGKGVAKGTLTYTVSFYPTLNIADPEDEEKEKEKEKSETGTEGKKSLDVPRSSEPGKFSTALENTDSTNSTSADSSRPVTPKTPLTPISPGFPRKSTERIPPKLHLTPAELLKYESGLVIFNLMEAELPKSNTRVEVFVDDMAFPSYVSSAAKHKSHKFDEIGDCFVRELEFSKLTIKVSEKSDKQEEDGKQHTLCRLTGGTLDTLQQCLNNPTTLKLKDSDGNQYSIKVSLKYVPVKMRLDPSESINNMGNLRVDVLDAKDLPSADSNGKSDPYVKFELNGVEVFKSKTVKKTLAPQWNELFEVAVPSRTAAKLRATVWDWDFADKPDFLGGADINLAQLEPFKAMEMTLILDGKSGTLRLRLLFRPDYVTRTKLGTSTFSGSFGVPGRIVTGVAGVPLKGGVAVAGAVGHGVGKGASFLKRGFRSATGKGSNDDSDSPTPTTGSVDIPIITTNAPEPTPGMGLKRSTGLGLPADIDRAPPSPPPNKTAGPANGAVVNHSRTKSVGASSVHSAIFPGASSGTASFTVLSASGYPPSCDVYVIVTQVKEGKSKTVGKTKHHKGPSGSVQFDETFKIQCTPDSQFKIEAREHHKLKSDELLGEAIYFVDDSNTGNEKELKVGNGTVVVKSSFVPADAASLLGDSPKSLRRSFLSKREVRAPSRESTPGS